MLQWPAGTDAGFSHPSGMRLTSGGFCCPAANHQHNATVRSAGRPSGHERNKRDNQSNREGRDGGLTHADVECLRREHHAALDGQVHHPRLIQRHVKQLVDVPQDERGHAPQSVVRRAGAVHKGHGARRSTCSAAPASRGRSSSGTSRRPWSAP